MKLMVPLIEYWTAVSFPKGSPTYSSSEPPDDAEEFEEWMRLREVNSEPIAEAESTGWRTICGQAAREEISIYGFGSLETDPASLSWYTKKRAPFRERVAPYVFLMPSIKLSPLDPIAIHDSDSGYLFNPAWTEPLALVEESELDQVKVNRAAYRTGFPGRPPIPRAILRAEIERRGAHGELEESMAKLAKSLVGWLAENHPGAPPVIPKSIQNDLKLGSLYRSVKDRPKSAS